MVRLVNRRELRPDCGKLRVAFRGKTISPVTPSGHIATVFLLAPNLSSFLDFVRNGQGTVPDIGIVVCWHLLRELKKSKNEETSVGAVDCLPSAREGLG